MYDMGSVSRSRLPVPYIAVLALAGVFALVFAHRRSRGVQPNSPTAKQLEEEGNVKRRLQV